jgi:hypothetical protein
MDEMKAVEEVLRLGSLLIITKAIKCLAHEFARRAPDEVEAGLEAVLQAIPQDLAEYLPVLDREAFAPYRDHLLSSLKGLLEEALAEAEHAARLN